MCSVRSAESGVECVAQTAQVSPESLSSTGPVSRGGESRTLPLQPGAGARAVKPCRCVHGRAGMSRLLGKGSLSSGDMPVFGNVLCQENCVSWN